MRRGFIILIYCVFFSFVANAQQEKFKALYMYNFTKFMKWPTNMSSGDFIIGVVGNSPVIKELVLLSKAKKVGGDRNLIVKQFASASELTPGCHIVYLPRAKSKELPEAAKFCYPNHALLITEYKDFAKKGSCVNFVMVDNYQKFELNPAHVNKAGIQIANKLLALAIVVN